MTKYLMMMLVASSLIACNSDHGKDKDASAETGFYGSYEAMDGCTTGRQIVNAASETEVKKLFCETLKDEAKNHNCASAQRRNIFQMGCEGTWPSNLGSGSSSTSQTSYGFSENACFTGFHVFAASSKEEMLDIYCRGLKENAFNHNCASGERQSEYQKNNCPSVLHTSYEDKSDIVQKTGAQ